MSTKIYVGNLPWRATDAQLTQLFSAHGEVSEARVVTDRETDLEDLRVQLLAGTYQPKPVKRQEIPKSGGGVRELGIPCVLDRFIQQAILQVLQPRFDPGFSEYSHGFRPGRHNYCHGLW